MRLIDVDAIPENEMNYPVWVCLKKQPTIDAVPVVRCKDCKHWEMGACLKIFSDGAVSKYAWQFREAEDFCSYGKRRSTIDENS